MDSGPAALGGPRADLVAALEPVLEPLGMEGVYDAVQDVYRAAPGYVEPEPELAALLRARFVGGSEAMGSQGRAPEIARARLTPGAVTVSMATEERNRRRFIR